MVAPGLRSRVAWALRVTGDNGAAASPRSTAQKSDLVNQPLLWSPLSPEAGGGDREPDPDRAKRHHMLFGRATVPGP